MTGVGGLSLRDKSKAALEGIGIGLVVSLPTLAAVLAMAVPGAVPPSAKCAAERLEKGAKAYCEMVTARFGLGAGSLAVELASNDGYLLQHFSALSVPCLGIEPAANVADIAIRRQSNETSAVSRPASAVDCTVRAARYSAARSFTFAIASSTLGRSMENVVSEVTTA